MPANFDNGRISSQLHSNDDDAAEASWENEGGGLGIPHHDEIQSEKEVPSTPELPDPDTLAA